jgi:2-methylisocitrate lyase-like PEP mutase family enzyme
MDQRTVTNLSTKIRAQPLLLITGASDSLKSRIIQDVGFEPFYVTGAGMSNCRLGLPEFPDVDMGCQPWRRAVDADGRSQIW